MSLSPVHPCRQVRTPGKRQDAFCPTVTSHAPGCSAEAETSKEPGASLSPSEMHPFPLTIRENLMETQGERVPPGGRGIQCPGEAVTTGCKWSPSSSSKT